MNLFPFQTTGAKFLSSRKYALLADEQGLGKTAQAIKAAYHSGVARILVVCPASIKYNWEREFNQWAPSYSVRVINKAADFQVPTAVTIINYDLIHRVDIARILLKHNVNLLICDEAHYLKNSRAKRTKVVYGKKGLSDIADRVWLLTGTPVMNRPAEIFPMLRRFIPDRLGKYADYLSFTKRYCAGYMGKFGWDASGASHTAELAEILGEFMLRRTKQEVLPELPEKIFQKIEFDPPSKRIEKLLSREKEAFEGNAMLGALATERREIGMSKIPFAIEHIENLLEEKEKIVVFAYHRDVLDTLAHALKDQGVVLLYGGLTSKQKQLLVDAFVTKPKYRIFLGQIDAAGIGIDGLQRVADTVIFVELSWVPGSIKQAIDRCHRIGQANKVLVQFLAMRGGIDERIFEALEEKSKVIKKLTVCSTEKKEEEMSIEKSLERIADALEKIATPPVVTAAPEVSLANQKPGKVKKEAPAPVVETPADFGDDPIAPEAPAFKTAKELLAYANSEIMKVEDLAKRKLLIAAVVEGLKEEVGVASIAAVPVEKLGVAKNVFDRIIAG